MNQNDRMFAPMASNNPDVRTACLVYAQDLPIYRTEKPYMILTSLDGATSGKTNIKWKTGPPEQILNIRGSEQNYTLDKHGFEFISHSMHFSNWDDRRAVEEEYLPQVAAFLKDNVEDADEVQIFDWRRRRVISSCQRNPMTDMNNPTDPLTPALFVHLDQSQVGVLKRVRLLNGPRAPELLRGRVRVINLWCPTEPVEDWPLAVCDGATMTYDDLLGVDLIRKDYIASTMYAKYRPGYSWFYLERQLPLEVCLFKNFDSRGGIRASMCPHVSFEQDNAPKHAKPRESIEVRAFVYTRPCTPA